MYCPKCSTENREGARFCGKCGASLRTVCPGCGTELVPELRFCDVCGRELAASPLAHVEASGPPNVDQAIQRLVPKEYAERLLAARGQVSRERRTVTMLFCDVKGSTAMAEALDPEDVMEIMDGAFDVLIEPVYRYEGTLARLMGDAILAFFGAPIAHEDDAERACRAALDIVAGAQDYAERLERERGVQGFNVRVGIHTGLVVVGEVGSDLRVEYTAMGDAVNLASRLESAAEPGTVLISEATHRLVAPLFDTEALGPMEVKGRAEPVPVYRVSSAKRQPGKVRGVAGLESPLVGREAERKALAGALERLQAGVGGIATVVGEAGIGKSRLVAEARKGAPHLRWVEGRCLSYGSSIAYLLWLDMLRGLLGIKPEDALEEVGAALQARVEALCPDRFEEVYPYLATMMSVPLETEVEARLSQLEGQELKAGTFRAVETLLASAARQGPVVLVGEDLHWADPTSVQLLEKLLP
ncbi:MAG: adenylate/guanylate cyclase domain-containing protein, partial [Anaerolineae bacterium]